MKRARIGDVHSLFFTESMKSASIGYVHSLYFTESSGKCQRFAKGHALIRKGGVLLLHCPPARVSSLAATTPKTASEQTGPTGEKVWSFQ